MYEDHATLRRYLVNFGYLNRDLAGRAYRIDAEVAAEMFEAAVESLDPFEVSAQAASRHEARKQAYFAKRQA